jgi:hypothetical protein
MYNNFNQNTQNSNATYTFGVMYLQHFCIMCCMLTKIQSWYEKNTEDSDYAGCPVECCHLQHKLQNVNSMLYVQ